MSIFLCGYDCMIQTCWLFSFLDMANNIFIISGSKKIISHLEKGCRKIGLLIKADPPFPGIRAKT